MSGLIDPRVTTGAVSLSVADLARSLDYYENNIGLRLLKRDNGRADLGAGKTVLLHLFEQPGARRVRGVTGLYHFAIRVPTRLDLARTLKHLAEVGTRIDGASDHLASEALYLSDPDGHGIEIYRDRPRERWYDDQGVLRLDTVPLDVQGVLGELAEKEQPWSGIHPETVMGHVHLHVADLKAADDFYVDLIGFGKPPTTFTIPTASFIGAGGYHHHLGLNIWAGAGAPPPPDDAARLLRYELLFPDAAALQSVLDRLDAAGVPASEEDGGWLVPDPSQNAILLRVGG